MREIEDTGKNEDNLCTRLQDHLWYFMGRDFCIGKDKVMGQELESKSEEGRKEGRISEMPLISIKKKWSRIML